jgi:hypothetical protein
VSLGFFSSIAVQFLCLAKGPTLMLIQLNLCPGETCMALSEIRYIAAERFSPCHGNGAERLCFKGLPKVWWIISVLCGGPSCNVGERGNKWIGVSLERVHSESLISSPGLGPRRFWARFKADGLPSAPFARRSRLRGRCPSMEYI